MTKSALIGLAAAVALCGCHSGAANRPGTTANAGSDVAGSPVTLVGCLVPGAGGSSTGAVGTSGDTAAAGFTLIDVTTTSTPSSDTGAASGAPAPSGTSGSSGTAAVDTGTPRSYSLIAGKAQDDLQKYQNSRVEVTGMAVASTDTGTGVPDVGAASAPTGVPQTSVERVRVDHVRQLDKNCNGTSQKR
jgi:hypothetical protein